VIVGADHNYTQENDGQQQRNVTWVHTTPQKLLFGVGFACICANLWYSYTSAWESR